MLDDAYFMRIALQEAQKAYEQGEIPVGAVLVHEKKLIAKAHNQTERLLDVTAHAEILCITAAAQALGGKYLPDCTLYVTLEPCAMCAGALAWAQLGRLVFAASDEKRGYRRHAPNILHPKTQVEAGLLAEEAVALIKDFFKKLRN
ncbi:nucleoside deaminase [Thermonema rossianum]|uniref:nucleoside deaminase n=1 Tax=Thermonema rossianum TaxID=55505 RepID=UPI00056F9C2D|nr:nucleoside deaminase [Thermonema rossianum]